MSSFNNTPTPSGSTLASDFSENNSTFTLVCVHGIKWNAIRNKTSVLIILGIFPELSCVQHSRLWQSA